MANVFDLYAGQPRETFWLIPTVWARYNRTPDLAWVRLDFKRDNAMSVPSVPGVYAFVLEHRVGADLPGAFPMYLGKAGTSIRDRYRAYQGQAFRGRRDRPKLDRMFKVWREHLAFYYVTDCGADTPETLEDALINTVMPPMNVDDFRADVRDLVKAF